MTPEKFHATVARLTAVAARDTHGYERRVRALALLGYAYLIGLGLLLAALTTGIVAVLILKPSIIWIQFAVPILGAAGAFVVSLTRALGIKYPQPTGMEITAVDAPALFSLVKQVAEELEAPIPHHILLATGLNGAISQWPKWGAFGGVRNYLLVGIGLIETTPPDEFRTVLAHELAHLSGRHGRFTAWISRMREMWGRMAQSLAAGGRNWLLGPFLEWYAPYFNAYTFVLSRTQEYEADRLAVRAAEPLVFARALIRNEVLDNYLSERVWRSIAREQAATPAPPTDAFERMSRALLEGPPPEDAERWRREALAVPTNNADTHPCLSDRLRQLGVSAESIVIDYRQDATNALENFGPDLEQWRERLQGEWLNTVRLQWNVEHDALKKEAQALAGLEGVALERALTNEEQLRRVGYLLRGDRRAEAMEILEGVVARDSSNHEATFALGRLHLEVDDERGVALLERAMNALPYLADAGSTVLHAYFQRNGRLEEAQALLGLMDLHGDEKARARAEQYGGADADKIRDHGLNPAEVSALAAEIGELPEVRGAWLVGSDAPSESGLPRYLLSLDWVGRPYRLTTIESVVKEVNERIKLPGDTTILTGREFLWKLQKRIRKRAGAQIFAR